MRPMRCPPLPGAVYLAVRRIGDDAHRDCALGAFSVFWDQGMSCENRTHWRRIGADEIHVHLLGRDEDGGRAPSPPISKTPSAIRLRRPIDA